MRLLGALAAIIIASGCFAIAVRAGQPVTTPSKIFIVNRMDSTVSYVDITTMKELKRIHVGPLPYFVALSGDGKTLAVTVEGEEKIKFYDVKSFVQKGEMNFGKMYADHLVLLPDGVHALMAGRYQDAVVGVNLRTMTEDFRIPCSSPHNLQVGRSGKYAYATSKLNPGISVIDLATNRVKLFIPTKFVPRGLGVSPDESRIYVGGNWVNGMFEFDAESGKLLRFDQFPLPPGKNAVTESTYHGFEPIGSDLILGTNEGLSALDVIDVKSGEILYRTTNVANPGAIMEIPGMTSTVLLTNLGDNSIEVVELRPDHTLKSLRKMTLGVGVSELPKRFVFQYE
jgi:DNA-binding beta-propeller fold protein YncE